MSSATQAVIVKNYLVNEKERNVIRLSDKSQVKLEVTNLKCIFVYVFVIIIITMMLYCCTFWLLSHEKKVGQKYLTYFAWINLFRAGNDALPLQNIVFSLSYKINFIIKRPNMSQIDAVIVFVFRLVFLNLFKSVYQFLVKWQFDGSQGTVLHIKLLYAYLGD